MSQTPSIPDLYAERAARFSAQAEALGARSRLVSNLRGLAFGLAVIAALFAAFSDAGAVAAAIAVIGAVAFVVLILIHARVIDAEDDARRWARVNRDAHARATGRWRNLPDDGARFARLPHAYADDLDLFGRGSLFQRVSVAHTRFGEDSLHRFLATPATAQIDERQAAVRALAGELETRQRLEALSLAVVEHAREDEPVAEPQVAGPLDAAASAVPAPGNPDPAVDASHAKPAETADPSAPPRRRPRAALRPAPDPEALLLWAEGERRLSQKPLLVWGARLLPPITIAGMIASAALGLPALIWGVPLLLQIALAFSASVETTRVFVAVSSTEGAFLRYGAMLELAENLAVSSTLLDSLRERLLKGKQRPSAAMLEFKRKVGWFDLRHNGLVHPFINALLLWDIHCVLGLERWQENSGRAARGWFLALGELEALSSFAGLAHDEPEFVFPEVITGPAVYEAEALGHVLIDAPRRVCNDVSLPEPGRALLVTGSNMSGKSTHLRAMGLAAVMAFAGAPVCAKRLRIAGMKLCTSVRVSDSLEQGVSHFYAEIAKLKAVVDGAHGPEPLLFLLDEILHGTNSIERQIGARWVLSELLRHGAIGAVSTHDLELCRLPDELMHRVTLVHFRENVADGQMTFDYKLRSGPVTAGNALRLMRIVGLDVPLQSTDE